LSFDALPRHPFFLNGVYCHCLNKKWLAAGLWFIFSALVLRKLEHKKIELWCPPTSPCIFMVYTATV
jgi:hypothetical protein